MYLNNTENGLYGNFGGTYVPEGLSNELQNISEEFAKSKTDESFIKELNYYRKEYIGRETPLYYAERLSKHIGGAKIYLKREDLCHTGAHKLNNVMGQILLAKKMGKTRIIAETGAGQHGVATATACAMFGLKCSVYMGEADTKRQALNVFRMKLLGAEVISVSNGQKTLSDAVDAALEDLMANYSDTFYLIGSAVGPHPYPEMVKHFQSIIGQEALMQIAEKEQRLPDYVVACVGGGSNAIGMFSAFLDKPTVKLLAAEAGGKGLDTKEHCSTLGLGSEGVIHGYKCLLLKDEQGNIAPTHSISAGLDYPGVSPELSYYKTSGRLDSVAVSDEQALEAFLMLSKMEGIIPALESSHAVYAALQKAKELPKDNIIVVNLSGRGDKDVDTVHGLLNKTS
ncbi:MAG: tryptophan synthase subunit beta [Lactobacillus sp.]|jgi:tryptophan synthase beta chain|nr:tryptophan synthase subunit beta [Lactobacillus sp.]